jgi:hypothetical protein
VAISIGVTATGQSINPGFAKCGGIEDGRGVGVGVEDKESPSAPRYGNGAAVIGFHSGPRRCAHHLGRQRFVGDNPCLDLIGMDGSPPSRSDILSGEEVGGG